MDQDTFTAEVRRVETPFAETGAAGPGNPSGYVTRLDVTYEVGFVLEGAWIKIASVLGTTVDALVARQRELAPPPTPGPTMADVAPNPVTPDQPAQQPAAQTQQQGQ